MFDVGSVVAHVKADLSDFESGIKKAKGQADDFGSHLGSVASGIGSIAKQSMLLAGIVGGAGLIAIKSSIDAYKDQENALKQQEAVLKSTHNAAGLYIQDLEDQASALQKVTPFADEAISAGQNLLLTFTSIKGPVFQKATETILDMSQALGQDLKSSAIQLGKALNDPIQGVTALRRVGVSFNEQQLTQIKTMQESGDLMGAQTLILNELSKEFGGSATAAAQTFDGQMTILKNSVGELQESLGLAIIRAITPFVKILTDFANSPQVLDFINKLGLYIENFILAFSDFDPVAMREVFPPEVITIIGFLVKAFEMLSNWIAANQELVITFLKGLGIALGVLLIIGTIAALVAALTNPLVLVALAIAALYTAWETNFYGIRDITTNVFNFLMPFIQAAWQIIIGYFQVSFAIIKAIVAVATAIITGNWQDAFKAIKEAVALGTEGVHNLLGGSLAYIRAWGGTVVSVLVAPFEDAWHRIQDLVNKIKDALDFTKRHSPSVVDVVKKGVGEVNRALGGLDVGGNYTPTVTPALTAGVGGNMSANNIVIDLSGAIISDDQAAGRIGEMIGDSIIKKLQNNVRI